MSSPGVSHPAPVPLGPQPQQCNVVAVGALAPAHTTTCHIGSANNGGGNSLELLVHPHLLHLECDLARVLGAGELVLAEDDKNVVCVCTPAKIHTQWSAVVVHFLGG